MSLSDCSFDIQYRSDNINKMINYAEKVKCDKVLKTYLEVLL